MTSQQTKLLKIIIDNFDTNHFHWDGHENYMKRMKIFESIKSVNSLDTDQQNLVGDILNVYHVDEDSLWGDLEDDEWFETNKTYTELCSMFS